MRKIFQYILMAVAVVVTASCSNELDETLQPAGNGTLQFVVGNFPAFGEGTQTRVIGTQDEGKTAWANGDQILIHLYSQRYEDQAVTLTFENNGWKSDGGTLSYLENEIPRITAVYAPDCEIKSDKTIGLSEGKTYGTAEYIPAKTTIEGNALKISFESGRTYSRLRIAALADQELSVTTNGFTPAGATTVATAPTSYTLTTDNNGNAFLYGTFAVDATVSVKHGDVVLKDYAFTADAEKHPNGTEQGKSYALDARPVIDGTFGGKTTATDAEIEVLVQQIKTYVDNGITTIIVPGSNPAIIDMGSYTNTAIGEAIYRLSGSGYKDNSTYLGKIDLILPDVTKIVDYEFQDAYALNSITLPKVTTVGNGAFYHCWYLQELTFGSVVTIIKSNLAFSEVGRYVDGGLCDLVLHREQVNAATEYQPDVQNKRWWNNTEWKSITLYITPPASAANVKHYSNI